MSYLTAIVMGLIQGIAEFLPISSSGHLAIFQNFFGMSDIEHDYMLFDVLLHLGTLIAVFVAYWGDIVTLVKEFFTMVHLRRLPAGQHPDYPARRMIVMLIVATLPLFLVLCGVALLQYFLRGLCLDCDGLDAVFQRSDAARDQNRAKCHHVGRHHCGVWTGAGCCAGYFPFRYHHRCGNGAEI